MNDLEITAMFASLRSMVADSSLLNKLASMSIGVAISKTLAIPTSALTDASYHFDTTLIHSAQEMIGRFNENYPINIDLATALCRTFWIIRYNAANPDLKIFLISKGPGTFVEKTLNTTVYLSNVDREFLNKNSEVMSVAVNLVQAVLIKIQEKDLQQVV